MMLDDHLYSVVGLAHRLGISFPEMMAMPYKEMQVWSAYFQRQHAEAQVKRK